jgi:hypothetical protein
MWKQRRLALVVLAAVGTAGLAAVVACGQGRTATSPSDVSTDPAGASGGEQGDAVELGGTGPAVVLPEAGLMPLDSGATMLCGCKLCAPVVSEDPCTSDNDCAPATPCHATQCVSRTKAVPRKPDTMCTMDIRCDSVDVNRCGCVQGRCTLSPPSD